MIIVPKSRMGVREENIKKCNKLSKRKRFNVYVVLVELLPKKLLAAVATLEVNCV